MRFANQEGRLLLITSGADTELSAARGVDLHEASGGMIPSEVERSFEVWPDVLDVARGISAAHEIAIDPARLEAPSPRPRQIFGIGINYADHGAEAGMERPEVPLVFTKLGPSVTGPFSSIPLPTEYVDWEVEIVVVIGKKATNVSAQDAWDVVAGITGGQDLSERKIQWRPAATPQFTLGKSLPGFSPMGPLLVTPDEFPNPDDIELACSVNGEELQRSRSSLMLFSVGDLIAYLSGIAPLFPGDVIFTGTPSGVGMTRTPPRYLEVNDQLLSTFEGIGTMSHTLVAAPSAKLSER
jgi:2,4-diketo-3-deoxy-L-fuconate hydrolase